MDKGKGRDKEPSGRGREDKGETRQGASDE